MKCPNCGADLLIDSEKEIRYCPYCGKQIELVKAQPHILVSVIREIGKQMEAKREYNKRKEEEDAKLFFRILTVMLLMLVALIGLCIVKSLA